MLKFKEDLAPIHFTLCFSLFTTSENDCITSSWTTFHFATSQGRIIDAFVSFIGQEFIPRLLLPTDFPVPRL